MRTPWEQFFVDKMVKIFEDKKSIIDIGGGLRVSQRHGNRYEKSRDWLKPYLEQVEYKILDPVDTFDPDIIGDIHNLPFENNSQDAILCLAVLEHVENPIKAVEEIHRVLKPGGYSFIYVPFLYYYHAEAGYYGDFWRFTRDSLGWLAKPFSSVEIVSVRGAIETWIKLSPLGKLEFLKPVWFYLDKLSNKINSNQVSGYNVFLVK